MDSTPLFMASKSNSPVPKDVVYKQFLSSSFSNSIPDATANTNLTHVVYTRKPDETASIYINSILQTTGIIEGDFASWDDSYDLLLANEVTNDRPWLGEYQMVAIFCRALEQWEVNQNYYAGPQPFDEFVYLPMISDNGLQSQTLGTDGDRQITIGRTNGPPLICPVRHAIFPLSD